MQKKFLQTLYIASFFISIQYAFTAYINSTFLSDILDEKTVGLVFTASAILSIIALLGIPKVLKWINNYHIFRILGFISILALLGLATVKSPVFLVILFAIYIVAGYLAIFSRDIFIEHYAAIESMGRIRGLFLTIINLGWIFAPVISGLAVNYFGIGIVYILAAVFFLPAIYVMDDRFHKFKNPVYQEVKIKDAIKKMVINKNLRNIYMSNFILQFFYSWMVIYTPIYLNGHLRFSWEDIGLIFMIMLIPFSLLQYPLGRISDKIGQKKILILGFFIIIISTAAIAFINSKSILIWGIALFATRVGAAIIEVMTEVYFFKKIGEEDIGAIGIFRNTSAIAYIVAPFLASIYFLFDWPFENIFIVLSIILISGLLFSAKIDDTKLLK